MVVDAIPELPEALLPQEDPASGLLTWLGTGLDALVLTAMQRVVDATLMPAPEDLPALRASADAVLDPALQADPKRYFDFRNLDCGMRPTHEVVRRELSGGVALHREFETAYQAFVPAGDPAVAEAATDRLHVEHWLHEPEHRRATVVALHGFTMGQPWMDAFALFASYWWEAGLDVALVTLPYHGARTPEDARFSGEAFAVPHVARLAEAVRRAVFEVRLLVDWLRESSDAPVGLLGLSLGGYLTALYAGLYDDLDFAVPIVPPVCIGDLAWRFFQASHRLEDDARSSFSHEELRSSYRVHSPLAHTLRMPAERVFIVAGRGDRIVPPEHPHALWEHWDRPGIYWFSGGHLTPFGRGPIARSVLDHLERLHIL